MDRTVSSSDDRLTLNYYIYVSPCVFLICFYGWRFKMILTTYGNGLKRSRVSWHGVGHGRPARLMDFSIHPPPPSSPHSPTAISRWETFWSGPLMTVVLAIFSEGSTTPSAFYEKPYAIYGLCSAMIVRVVYHQNEWPSSFYFPDKTPPPLQTKGTRLLSPPVVPIG